jgi:hypothetical protein
MLKGTTTIQLFNAKTGALEAKRQDENMVTNAIYNLFDFDPRWWRGYSDLRTVLAEYTPIYSKLLGGVLLWDSLLPENPNLILKPSGVKNVGFAGTTYAGSSAFRGTYNNNESGEIAGGYRHVWDFGTDKANGTIRCVSLTSQYGGNCGWNADFSSSDALFFRSPVKLSETGISGLVTSGSSGEFYSYLGSFKENKVLEMTTSKDTQTFREYDYAEKAFHLNSDYNTYHYSNNPYPLLKNQKVITLNTPNVCAYNRLFLDEQGRGISLYSIDASTVALTIFDFMQLSVVSQSAITLYAPQFNNVQNNAFALWKDHLYLYNTTQGKYAKVALNGDLVEYLPLDSAFLPSRLMGVLGEYLTIGKENLTKLALYDGNEVIYVPVNADSLGSVYQGQIQKRFDPNVKLPYFPCRSFSVDIRMIAPYIATINNLSAPITKTSAHTMKITYDIYNE